MKFKYEILYKHYALKKNIIHIRLTNHTGYPDKLIECVFPMEIFQTEYRLQKEQFPLENRIILVEILPLKFTELFPLKQRKNFQLELFPEMQLRKKFPTKKFKDKTNLTEKSATTKV